MVQRYFASAISSDDSSPDSPGIGNAVLAGVCAVTFSLSSGRNEVLHLSASAANLYGEDVTLLRQSPNFWLEAIHADDRHKIWMAIGELIQRREPASMTRYRLVASDGEVTPVIQICRPVFDDLDQLLRLDFLVVAAPDERLPRSQWQFDSIAQQASSPMLLRDLSGKQILDANEAAQKLFGASRSALIRTGWYRNSAARHGFGIHREQKELEAARQGESRQYRWMISPFDALPQTTWVKLVQIRQGEHHALLTTLQEETAGSAEQKLASEALELLNASTIVVVNANAAGQIQAINKNGHAMLGLNSANIPDLFLKDLLPSWARPHFQHTSMPEAVRNGLWKGEMVLESRDRHQYPVSMLLIYHHEPEERKGFTLAAMDISDIKRRELRYKQAKEKLETDNLITEKLLENVSAGMYAPLTIISSAVDALTKSPEKLTEYLPALRRASIQAQRLVAAVTEFLAAGGKDDMNRK